MNKINRRDFLELGLAASTSYGLQGAIPGAGWTQNQLDRFGGWSGKKFKATGFFRLEKEKRWWLVTPEGHAFLSYGINHLHPNWWQQEYNRKAWEKRLDIKDIHGPDFHPALRKWFLTTCQEYGFNTVGVHNQLSIVNRPQSAIPYVQKLTLVDIPHWKRDVPDAHFLDVFSNTFEQRCDQMAQEIARPVKEDPFLLGYALTDCPLFTEEDCRARPDVIGGAPRKARIGWPRRLRNLGGEAPGKQAYVDTMQELYHDDIADFNVIYGTKFESFGQLAAARDWRTDTDLSNAYETRDNVQFLKRVVAKYYQTARDSIRQHDPNHLFMGDKINANTDTLDTLLPTTTQYTDLIYYQMYGRWDIQSSSLDRWSKQTDQPFINGDAAFTMITDTMPRPYGPVADNIIQRAAWTAEFFRGAFARPEFVGWHYCGLIDGSNQIPSKTDRQHSGLLDGYGNPYPELRKVLKTCAQKLYTIAMQG
ncbi:MAG: hypothetical protein HKN87_24585 [Saprospiraceae bacterium]|nr:hypothetical protein [Saprospiraceae bacterium]